MLLLTFSCDTMAEWVEYSTRSNGDVFYFDNARVQKNDNLVKVWNRIRYKSSVMGASSYQSFLEIDCYEYSETTLQSTYYNDKSWTTPAMTTDTKKTSKEVIKANSATEHLADTLCK